MTLSLPAGPPRARSLTGVVTQAIAALEGRSEWFATARSAVVFVVDGLGSHNLAERRGHARFLGSAGSRRDVARTVFPSTTAAALTSLLTGAEPGEHGIVGYRTRIPGTSIAANQLHGWETDGLDPRTWQRSRPLLEIEAEHGRPCFVVSRPDYTGTGFTAATLRGAEFVSSADVRERAAIAADLAARHPGALVYLYAPDLDTAGHRDGWESDRWTDALERVDAAARDLNGAIDPGTGVLVTADHGMVDVPAHKHVLLSDGDPLLEDVEIVGGEPRMLHLYVTPGRADAVASRWRERDERAHRRRARGRARTLRLLRRPRERQAPSADGGPARVAHRRGTDGSAPAPRRVRLRAALTQLSSVRAPKTISSHEGMDGRPLARRPESEDAEGPGVRSGSVSVVSGSSAR